MFLKTNNQKELKPAPHGAKEVVSHEADILLGVDAGADNSPLEYLKGTMWDVLK